MTVELTDEMANGRMAKIASERRNEQTKRRTNGSEVVGSILLEVPYPLSISELVNEEQIKYPKDKTQYSTLMLKRNAGSEVRSEGSGGKGS